MTLIFKNRAKYDIINFSCISKLCVFGKVLENLVYDLTLKYVLYSGGMNFFHTLSNLISFDTSCIVYTNFSKALDKVNHNLLIMKLSEINVHGELRRQIRSYVFNRSLSLQLMDRPLINSSLHLGFHKALLWVFPFQNILEIIQII